MAERWRYVPGTTEYLVSSLGRVWRKASLDRRGCPRPAYYMKPTGKNKHIHAMVSGKLQMWYVGRLVLTVFVGPCPPGQQCRHLNDEQHDNRLDNLAWGTAKQNRDDALRNGRHRRRITHLQFIAIKLAYGMAKAEARRKGLKRVRAGRVRDLTKRYGISSQTVYDIGKGHITYRYPVDYVRKAP